MRKIYLKWNGQCAKLWTKDKVVMSTPHEKATKNIWMCIGSFVTKQSIKSTFGKTRNPVSVIDLSVLSD